MATKCFGILTAGGDCPGLNAAIRGVGRPLMDMYQAEFIGFRDGFRGLIENRVTRFADGSLSGILTIGGTILGTSRDKLHRMTVGGEERDMTDVAVENYRKQHLDALICLGGGGTQKNALRLAERGLNIVTLPKTIDNDVAKTDVSFGFDTAMSVAAEAIDRLHSTAESHHRVILVEIMGHNAGWLALGAGIAGGADVILIPEIPFSVDAVASALIQRNRKGKRFSIVAMAEGAQPKPNGKADRRKNSGRKKESKKDASDPCQEALHMSLVGGENCARLAHQLEDITGLEMRVTSLGHLQRGGTPSPADRLLATRLGTACAQLVHDGEFGVMVGLQGNECVPVPLIEVAGNRKTVPLDHPWLETARLVGTSLGEEK